MGAMFADECDLAACIAEGHQVFAEQPHAYRRSIAARQIVGRHCGYPIAPEQFAHRSAGARSRQKLVFFTLHWGLIVAALYERRQSGNSESPAINSEQWLLRSTARVADTYGDDQRERRLSECGLFR